MLAQLGADAGKKNRKFERLSDIVIGPCIQPQDRVGIAVMPREHQDRAFHATFAHPLAQLATIGIGQAHIKDHKIIGCGLGLFHAFSPSAGFEDVKVFGHHQLL